MRIGRWQIDVRSLVIGILMTVVTFLLFNGTPSGAQRSRDLTQPSYIPNHYQITNDGSGVYILNTATGQAYYVDKGKCSPVMGCRGPEGGMNMAAE